MTLPAWLVDVLDRELPQLVGSDRDRLAEAILAALPAVPIAQAIRISAIAHLVVNNVGHPMKRHDIASDIANNAAMGVVESLSAGDEAEEESGVAS